jgi:hypothetical protein
LKNKAQQPVRAVKLEFQSAKLRKEVVDAGEVSALNINFKVVEYLSQANALICSTCYGIGHFRKNCTQKEEVTCVTCGGKCSNLKDHQGSGILKYIHCESPHRSNDSACRVVKDYRAALTRNLLSNVVLSVVNGTNHLSFSANIWSTNTTTGRLLYATVTQMMPTNPNDVLLKRLDSILAKVEEESNATRTTLGELKDEMRNLYEETKEQVVVLEKKVKTIETKFEDLTFRLSTVMQNICMTLLDSQGSQDPNWKSYWQEEIEKLKECRSSFSKST